MAAESQLNPTQPVNQQIYRILRRDIVHCLIPPGTPLSEKEVSVRFDVSRQPVREAFIKLAENGLIQIRPQRGSYVNKISLSQVRNGCFVRQAIECAVARRAVGGAAPDGVIPRFTRSFWTRFALGGRPHPQATAQVRRPSFTRATMAPCPPPLGSSRCRMSPRS